MRVRRGPRHCKPDEAAKPLGGFSREGADEEEGKPGDRSAAEDRERPYEDLRLSRGGVVPARGGLFFCTLRRGEPQEGRVDAIGTKAQPLGSFVRIVGMRTSIPLEVK